MFVPAASLILLSCLPLRASTATINFDDLPVQTKLSNQYPGISFGTVVIGPNVYSPTVEDGTVYFPARSSSHVAFFDSVGPYAISFANPIQSFSAYFTYEDAVIMVGLDEMGNQVAISKSQHVQNIGTVPGEPDPNELISVSYTKGISSVIITTNMPWGAILAMDDATFVPAIPEAASGTMLGIGLVGLCVVSRWRRIVPAGTRCHSRG
jgi:hypothetical protein